tara:strand:+ start:817 stop:984 length:168 start_codon:yes stop_codon:yes gene_type:complete
MKLLTYLIYTLLALHFMGCSMKKGESEPIDTLVTEQPDTMVAKIDTIVVERDSIG